MEMENVIHLDTGGNRNTHQPSVERKEVVSDEMFILPRYRKDYCVRVRKSIISDYFPNIYIRYI
jgi:hypothetical protein